MERVAEHHVEAERAGLGDLERLHHRLGGERDEGRRARRRRAPGAACRCGHATRDRACGSRRRASSRDAPGKQRPAADRGPPPGRRPRPAIRRRSGPGRGLLALEGRAALPTPIEILLRLALLGLRDADLEDAVVELGRHGARVDALGERQRAGEAAEGPLDAVVALLALLVLGLALARDGEDVVLELDGDVLLGAGPGGRRGARSDRRSRADPSPGPSDGPARRRCRRRPAARRTRC